MTIARYVLVLSVIWLWQVLENKCYAQVFERPVVVSDHFFYKSGYFNPAQNMDTLGCMFQVGRRAYTGLLSGVSQNVAHLYGNLGKSNQGHLLGLAIVNVREGDYVQRNRIYIRYAKTIALNTKWSMSLGTSIGLINHVFQGTVVSSGGSDFKPDMNIGISIRGQKVSVGGAMQQVFNPVLSPVRDQLTYNRYWNVHATHVVGITPQVQLQCFGMTSFRTIQDWNLRLAPVVVVHEMLEAGLEYLSEQGVLVLLGVRELEFSKRDWPGALHVMVSFLVLNTRNLYQPRDNVLELTMGYRF